MEREIAMKVAEEIKIRKAEKAAANE